MQEPLITISLSEYQRLKEIELKYEKNQRKEIDKMFKTIQIRVCEALEKQKQETIENYSKGKLNSFLKEDALIMDCVKEIETKDTGFNYGSYHWIPYLADNAFLRKYFSNHNNEKE